MSRNAQNTLLYGVVHNACRGGTRSSSPTSSGYDFRVIGRTTGWLALSIFFWLFFATA